MIAAVGAGYVAAMLTDDRDLVAGYEAAFPPADLLHALHAPLMSLGRRVALDSHRDLAELGDALVGAALLAQRNR